VADFYISTTNTQPVISDRITDSDGNVADLIGRTVKFVMVAMMDFTVVINAGASILYEDPEDVPAGAANVRYSWLAADTATAGVYYARWHVYNGANLELVYPNVDPIVIQVVPT
jgi:hypothetical protein